MFVFFIKATNRYATKAALALLFLLLFTRHAQAQAKDTVVYSPARKLGWDDFKGTPDSDTFAARSTVQIVMQVRKTSIWTGQITFRCFAVLYPDRTWVRPAYKEERTLQHEQTHFDIASFCAKDMEKEMNQQRITSVKSPLINVLKEKWDLKMKEMQMQFDAETKGGNDLLIQGLWIKSMNKALRNE